MGDLQLGGATLAAWCYLRHANYVHPTLIKRLLHHCTELLNRGNGQATAGPQHLVVQRGVHDNGWGSMEQQRHFEHLRDHQQQQQQRQQSTEDCTPVLLLTLTASFASCKDTFPDTSALFSSIAARASAVGLAAQRAPPPSAMGAASPAAGYTSNKKKKGVSEGSCVHGSASIHSNSHTHSTSTSHSSHSTSRPMDSAEHEALMQLLSILTHPSSEPAPELHPKRVAAAGVSSSSSESQCKESSSHSGHLSIQRPVAYPTLPLSLRLTPTYEGSKLDWEWGRNAALPRRTA